MLIEGRSLYETFYLSPSFLSLFLHSSPISHFIYYSENKIKLANSENDT